MFSSFPTNVGLLPGPTSPVTSTAPAFASDCRSGHADAGDRLALVRTVLWDDTADLAVAAATLRVDLTAHHVAVVLWSDDEHASEDGSADVGALVTAASRLAQALGSARPLVVRAGPTEIWAWLTGSRLPVRQSGSVAATLRRSVPPPPGVHASIGPVAEGVAGFRRSHLCALEAARVVRSAPGLECSWTHHYSELAVLAMLTRDPVQATAFAADTLGPLGRSGRGHDDLRETLRVYLAFGRSRLLAAETLHVARNTVAYRVEKAVALLGHPIHQDSLPLRLALEIARILPIEEDTRA